MSLLQDLGGILEEFSNLKDEVVSSVTDSTGSISETLKDTATELTIAAQEAESTVKDTLSNPFEQTDNNPSDQQDS